MSKSTAYHNAKRRYYDQNRDRATLGRRGYTPLELQLILTKAKPDAELAKDLGRTIEAVQVKRSKLLRNQAAD